MSSGCHIGQAVLACEPGRATIDPIPPAFMSTMTQCIWPDSLKLILMNHI